MRARKLAEGPTRQPAITVRSEAAEVPASAAPWRSPMVIRLLAAVFSLPCVVVPASAVQDDTTGICSRTEKVRNAIVAVIPGVSDCADVTSAHLAAVAELDLIEAPEAWSGSRWGGRIGTSALMAGDFDDLTNLTRLLVSGYDGLTSVPAGIFDDLTNLTRLVLSSTELTFVPAGIFDDLTNLTDLALSSPELTSLPAGIFDGLTELTYLGLDHNALTSLPAGIFDNLTKLQDLWLSDNDLTSLPAGIFDGLTQLTWLHLGNNELASVPAGIFDNLTELNWLSLGRSALTSLPAGIFDNLTELQHLSLDQNALTSLPVGIFDNLTELAYLMLFSNPLTSVPAGIFDNLTKLRSLQLSGNELTSLPAGIFDRLTNLRFLSLSGNELMSLPAGLFANLGLLENLILSENPFTTLPAGFFEELASSATVEFFRDPGEPLIQLTLEPDYDDNGVLTEFDEVEVGMRIVEGMPFGNLDYTITFSGDVRTVSPVDGVADGTLEYSDRIPHRESTSRGRYRLVAANDGDEDSEVDISITLDDPDFLNRHSRGQWFTLDVDAPFKLVFAHADNGPPVFCTADVSVDGAVGAPSGRVPRTW